MTIHSLADYIRTVRKISEDWTPPGVDWYLAPWFRGHGDVTWSLIPGHYRVHEKRDGVGLDWYNERNLLSEFKFRAPSYLPPGATPKDDWEWLFLMQHYGLPTRLLDWTDSSLIALYFALRDNKGATDAAVWALNPWTFNQQSFGEMEIPYSGDERLLPWATPRTTVDVLSKPLPVAIKAIQSNPRITAQRGCFTIHGAEIRAFHTIEKSARVSPPIACMKIPQERVIDIKRDLEIAGIGETSIFPELEGLCREIRGWFYPAG